MIPALLVFGYAIVMAWFLPLPLGRLSAAGVSPRLGLAAWLTAMTSVLAPALAALGAAGQGGRRRVADVRADGMRVGHHRGVPARGVPQRRLRTRARDRGLPLRRSP